MKGSKGESMKLDEFNIENVRAYCKEQEIDLGKQLNSLKITIKPENSKSRTENLRDYIDFISDSYECLLEDRWHRFNLSYLEHLDQLIDKIRIETYNSANDIHKKEFEKYLKANPKSYVEKYFNELRTKEGYVNKDRFFLKLEKRYTIELLDLYKDKLYLFCEGGNPSKTILCY